MKKIFYIIFALTLMVGCNEKDEVNPASQPVDSGTRDTVAIFKIWGNKSTFIGCKIRYHFSNGTSKSWKTEFNYKSAGYTQNNPQVVVLELPGFPSAGGYQEIDMQVYTGDPMVGAIDYWKGTMDFKNSESVGNVSGHIVNAGTSYFTFESK